LRQEEGAVIVAGTAGDDVGVIRVEGRIDDGGWAACAGQQAWSCPRVSFVPGTYRLQVRAWDAAGHSATDELRLEAIPAVVDPGEGEGEGAAVPAAVPQDLSGVTWLHTDVSGWAPTADLAAVRVGGGQICFDHDKANVWPGVEIDGLSLNANPWIFVWQDNRWYAATFEWMRVGQTCKSAGAVAGDHIKRAPLQDFRPVSGTRYGFMISGLARAAQRNVLERSRVVMVEWP